MANNVTLNPGSGGDSVWADDVSGVKVQGVKLVTGPEDVGQYGASFVKVTSTGSGSDETAIKATAGCLYGVLAVNVDTSVHYIQLFDAGTGSVTPGTTAPSMIVPLPAGGGVAFSVPIGIKFATAITAALTTTPTGATSVTADKVFATFLYA